MPERLPARGLIVTSVKGSAVVDNDTGERMNGVIALHFSGLRTGDSVPTTAVVVLSTHHAAAVIGGLRLMFAEAGLAEELARLVARVEYTDRRNEPD